MMIGNDIADLYLAEKESNRHRKGWLQKLFTDSEQQLITGSNNGSSMTWLLWTMKEAAYKIINRENKVMSFAPAKLKCSLISSSDGDANGLVQFDAFTYNTFSTISEAYIHTIAVTQNNLPALNVYIREEQSKQLQEYPGYTFFKDEFGIPHLVDDKGRLRVISKSHHGRFEAVVY